VAATLHLARAGRASSPLIELRRGTFHVLLDGKDVGSIEWHQTVDVPVEPGHHTLQVRHGRYASPERSFDAANGEMVSFRCMGANLWFIYVASFAMPNLGIVLKRE
jgi:hypothetical protein